MKKCMCWCLSTTVYNIFPAEEPYHQRRWTQVMTRSCYVENTKTVHVSFSPWCTFKIFNHKKAEIITLFLMEKVMCLMQMYSVN